MANDFGAKVRLTVDTSSKKDFNNQIQALVEEIDVGKHLSVSQEAINALVNDIQTKLKATPISIESIKVNKIDVSSAVANARQELQAMFASLGSANVGTGTGSAVDTSGLKQANSEMAELGQTIQQTSDTVSAETNNIVSNLNKVANEEKRTAKEIEQSSEKQEKARERASTASDKATQTILANATRVAAARRRIEQFLEKNPKVQNSVFGDQLRGLLDILNTPGGIDVSKLNDVNTAFNDISGSARAAGMTGRTLLDVISDAYKRFGGWTIITRSLTAVIHGFRDVITNVTELDTAMTELRKVTDETDATYSQFFDNAITRAKSLGATVSDTISATADFARLGYDIDEAANLADAALVYKNVGDGIEDVGTASESIISTMKAFGIEAENSMSIVDAFNEVGKFIA